MNKSQLEYMKEAPNEAIANYMMNFRYRAAF